MHGNASITFGTGNGMPHESVREIEVLCGDGRVGVARPDNEHADLFRGSPTRTALSGTRCG